MATAPTLITELPDAPDRADRTTFSARATAMFTALKNAFVFQANGVATVAYTNAQEAETAAMQAQAAASAAIAAAGAVTWISGTTYTAGVSVISPANGQVYRRLTNGAGTTDPSADAINWAQISLVIPQETPATLFFIADNFGVL